MEIKLSFREKVIGFITLLVIIFSLFEFFLFAPKREQYKILKKELNTLSEKIENTSLYFSDKTNIYKEVVGLKQQVDFFENIISRKNRLGPFLEKLGKLCRELNIEVLRLRPQEIEQMKKGISLPYKCVLVDMEMRGTYESIVRYMRALETLPFFIIIDEMEIEREETLFPKLKFYLVIETVLS